MKAIIINASPRKNGNTAALLDKVRDGLEASGCETKTVSLATLKFRGCISCLACKVKGNKCDGLCALRDELRPVLEETFVSDILILGSPVYFHYPVAAARAFTERLLFAPLDYTNPSVPHLKKKIHCACLYTMHMPSDKLFAEYAYEQTLGMAAKSFEFIGSSEVLYFRGLTVFKPHDRYEISPELIKMFDDIKSRNYADYEAACVDLGKRLADKAAMTIGERRYKWQRSC